MESSWNNDISSFRDSLKEWNTNVFGDILKKKKKIIRRFQGITNTLDQGNNNFLEKLRGQIWKEYQDILTQEEILYYQKSRSKWLEFGNRNTKFFHGSTMIRRRKNKINLLHNDMDNPISDPNILESMTLNFFADFYKDNNLDFPFVLRGEFPILCDEDISIIGKNILHEEIKHAVFGMGGFKAPGRDNFQVIFFQSQWEKVKNDLCLLIGDIF
ncbi:uncharacterized protein LOC107467759 [Arachis duranensis]|uniref:Uncharacterized protein LOC107467759 n=1 Tax=Arachis duranensis TaxID=130453 RepID=A0A6P4BHL3_ARADU|nr:uncharacterized protein LOC107467759 [Arachis duranensis]